MRSKKIKKQKTENLRTKHIVYFSFALSGACLMMFTDDWSSYIGLFCACFACFTDCKCESEDELSEKNVQRSNTIVMWVLIAALIVLAGYNRWQKLSYAVYLCIACLAIALRSALFLWFDRIPKKDSEDG